VLEVQLSSKVSKKGFVSLSKLTKLQEFVFIYDDPINELNQKLLRMCFTFLPHLHVAAYRPVSFFSELMMDLGAVTTFALRAITTPCTLQLRQLVLTCNILVPENIALPELSALYLVVHISAEYDEFDVNRFPKLVELNSYLSDMAPLMRVLRIAGRRLKVLRFMVQDVVQLDELLEACPYLSELNIASNEGLQSATQLRPDTLGRLKELAVSCESSYFNETIQKGLLVHMLRLTPKLQVLHLKWVILNESDLTLLAELGKERVHLRKLEEFHMWLNVEDIMVTEKYLLIKAIISLAINLGRLRTICVYPCSGEDWP
jgi:hypothetical protein